MKEFTPEKLYEWRSSGVRYIGIEQHTPELIVDEELTEFKVIPFLAIQDAQQFLAGRMVSAISEENESSFFPVDSAEAIEIATGITACRFYVA